MLKNDIEEINKFVDGILYKAWLGMDEEQFEINENLIIEILDDPAISLLKDKHFNLLLQYANKAERKQLKQLKLYIADIVSIKL